MATPVKKSAPVVEEKKADPVVEEKKADPVVEEKKAADPEVKDLVSKIMLVNPFTQVRAYPGTVVKAVVVDSFWESQVKAGLAKWL